MMPSRSSTVTMLPAAEPRCFQCVLIVWALCELLSKELWSSLRHPLPPTLSRRGRPLEQILRRRLIRQPFEPSKQLPLILQPPIRLIERSRQRVERRRYAVLISGEQRLLAHERHLL